MEDGSYPGQRPTPVGKAAKKSIPTHRSRKLPSPVSSDVIQNDANLIKHERIDANGIEGKSEDDETPTKDTDQSSSASPTSPVRGSKVGVAYISENLIKRQSREENLANVTSLNLTLGRDLNKKFRYLENLENLKKLQVLHISNHMIEKIEKLDKLTQLRELNLSRNSISKIEGLECLVHLQILNLNRNYIQHLPATLLKKLRELRVFHFAHNELESLLEVTKLRSFQDLTEVSMIGNPMSALAHSHQFVIFQLRSLTILDGQTVMEEERVAADDRFGQDEVQRLETELTRQNKLYDALFEEKHSVTTELERLTKLHSQQKEKDSHQTVRLKELQRELQAKEDILASKTTELSKACEKQYKLEQELAFYKLDAKFEHLGKMPWPDGVEFPEGDEDDESPYIGKAGFKPNKFARESQSLSPSQTAQMSELGARLSDKYDEQNKKALEQLHKTLMMDLRDKEMALQKAEDQLVRLEEQLRRRREQLKEAQDELASVQQAIEEEIQLLDDEEKRLYAAIADKKKYIRQLQDVASELEERMNKIGDDLRRKDDELKKLQHKLNTTSPDDPSYGHLQTRLAAAENQLRNALQEYDQLKKEYDKALERLQAEMAALQQLEDELASKRKVSADEGRLKGELKDIVDDLNSHLEAMKKQVAQQQLKIGQLQREKDALENRLKGLQDKAGENNQLKNNNARLKQQLQAAQDALDREKANAQALHRRLSELEGQVAKGSSLEPLLANTKARLKAAEAEVEKLRNALDKLRQQNKADRQAVEDRIHREQEKVEKALQAVRTGLDKERETKELAVQVDGLKAKNADLEDRIKEMEDELQRSFDKDEVFDRLGDLQDDMDNNREQVRQPLGEGDELGGALGDLHRRYLDMLGALKKEKQGGKVDKDTVDAEIKGLSDKLDNLRNVLRQANDRAGKLAEENELKDAQLSKLRNELQKLKDSLAKQGGLQEELARQKAAHKHEVDDLQEEIARLKEQLERAQHTMEHALASASAPLEAKIRNLENKLDQLQNRLAKSKADGDRRRFAMLKANKLGQEAALEGFGVVVDIDKVQDLESDVTDMTADSKLLTLAQNMKRMFLRALHGDYVAEQKRLEAQLGALEDALRDAKAREQHVEDKRARDKRKFEAQVKELEDELARANERLERLLENADDELDRARAVNAAKVQGLEDELDRLRRMQQRADQKEAKNRELEGLRARQMEDELAALRDQLQRAKIMNNEQLDKADKQNAALQSLLDEKSRLLQNGTVRDNAQQTQMRGLQYQMDELRKMLKDAENQALRDKYEKDLDALRAEQWREQAQAIATKELADAQQQIAGLQALLDAKDQQLQSHVRRGTRDAASVAPQRDEISNLASALATQNAELERLREYLAQSVTPQVDYTTGHGPSLSSLASEVEALRAALRDREQQVQALVHGYHQGGVYPGTGTPTGYVATPMAGTGVLTTPMAGTAPGLATTGVVTTPGVSVAPGVLDSSLVTTPGEVHHHHHFKKESRHGRRSKVATGLNTEAPVSPTVLGTTVVGPSVSPSSVHHHHYDGLERSKRRKNKDVAHDSFCNVAVHGDLEYEVGRLEGMLTVTTQQAETAQDQRDSLRVDLRSLENEVDGALRSRMSIRRPQHHSLDGTLAESPEHVQPSETAHPHIESGFPAQYLQYSDTHGDEPSHPAFPAHRPSQSELEANREYRLNELTHIDSILSKRRMELQEVSASLAERRQELDNVIGQCKRSEDRLRRAEEDASYIEQRASETSAELIRAGNQLLNLELKTRGMTDTLNQLNTDIEVKKNVLLETERSYNKTKQDMERINSDLEGKKEELEFKGKRLVDIEERLKLSLKLGELREAVTATEKEEQAKTERRLSALKDGEKIVEERTSQLARTRNELQKQTTEYHELNTNITRARKALDDLETGMVKKEKEIEELAKRREEERSYQANVLEETNERLKEVHEARNDALTALRKHREELLELRERLQEEDDKLKEYEEGNNLKQLELDNLCVQISDKENQLGSVKDSIKEVTDELEKVRMETKQEKNALNDTVTERNRRTEQLEEMMKRESRLVEEIRTSRDDLESIKRETRFQEQVVFETSLEMRQLQSEVEETKKEVLKVSKDKEALEQHLINMEQDLSDRKTELQTIIESKHTVMTDLEHENKKYSETKRNHEEFEAELSKLRDEVARREADLEEQLRTERPHERDIATVSSTNDVELRRNKRRGAQLPVPTAGRRAVRRHGKNNAEQKTNNLSKEGVGNSKVLGRRASPISTAEVASNDDEGEANQDEQDSRIVELEGYIQELTADKDNTRQALNNSLLEVNRLKAEMETEKDKANQSLKEATLKAKDHEEMLEQLHEEHAQDKLRATREVEYFRMEAQEHYSNAQKLSEELNTIKEECLRNKKKENLEGEIKTARGDMELLASQMKSEIIQGLKEVEASREETLQDIKNLQKTKDGMEMQLVALQKSLNEATKETMSVQKSRTEISRQEKEEAKRKLSENNFARQQGLLRDQLRQQMSRRAEILDEERKRAGKSLEGLKSKLKNLEQVIGRKDSSVQDFRLELAKSRVDKEKTVEMEKELGELKRRLQEVQDERDVAVIQRDHFASLGEQTSHLTRLQFTVGQPTTLPHQSTGSVEHLKHSEMAGTSYGRRSSDAMPTVYVRREDVSRDVSIARLLDRLQKQKCTRTEKEHKGSRRNGSQRRKGNEPLNVRDLVFADSESEELETISLRESDIQRRNVREKDIANKNSLERSCDTRSYDKELYTEKLSALDTSALRMKGRKLYGSLTTGSDKRESTRSAKQEIAEKELKRDDYLLPQREAVERNTMAHSDRGTSANKGTKGTRMAGDREREASYGPLTSTGKDTMGIDTDLERTSVLGVLSVSSIAEDKKTKFLASVNRLKNEKIKELEIGLQQILQHQ